MKLLDVRYMSIVTLSLALLTPARAGQSGGPAEKDGRLIVSVILGDLDNSPATAVHVEAFGFVESYHSMKSFVLPSSRPGQYELSLPPGVYDVFVSESISEPRCRRVLVKPGSTYEWLLKLETDYIYTEK